MEKILMTEMEVRDMLGIGRTTFWRMRRQGGFPTPINMGTRSLRFRRHDVEAWVSEGGVH
ncbi:helix-turn-helix domain-containing protein [Azospirillum baldaniorum]|uniref:helix-turn-helix transcriptional regulator n=1 Tax=Azospirillum baldaniorum TaxID=1064539 RepID=UPI0011A9E239